MKIPIPCEFGEYAECNNKMLPFVGVDWFKWTQGMEYTYFFKVNNEWHNTDFYTTYKKEQKSSIEIPNELLEDTFIKDRGFPLKGKGYATGVFYKDGKTYIDFIISSNYFEHIRVQCDKNGVYVKNGDIIFPTGWDTKKKEKAVLKSILKLINKDLVR